MNFYEIGLVIAVFFLGGYLGYGLGYAAPRKTPRIWKDGEGV